MATVYLAEQRDLARQVALKELSSFHARDASLAARFLREAQLSGSLTHPNVVTVYEYLVENAVPYIAMEYCPRGSLRSRVHSVTLAQAAGVIEGVLAALAVAEPRGIVHRDLKPENLMITNDGGIKITDFGIAKAVNSAATPHLTMTGSTVGTPHYMAPEQAMGLEVGPYTDLYSVGIVAFEMLTGRVPYADTATPMAVLLRQVNDPIESVSALRPDLDPVICRWVDQMVAKDPSSRPASAGAAWEQFEDAVLAVLGPRWRRQARLLGSAEELSTAKPLTPAPFASIGGETIGSPGAPPIPSPAQMQALQTIAPEAVAEGGMTMDAPAGQQEGVREHANDTTGDRLPADVVAVEGLAPMRAPALASATPQTHGRRPRGLKPLLLLIATLVAIVVAGVVLVHVSGGSSTQPPTPGAVGTRAVAGRPVSIGSRRVVLTALGNQPWLVTRGEGADPGTLAPVAVSGKPGTPITLAGIPAGIGGGAGALWVLEESGYQHPTVFLERFDPVSGDRRKVRSFPGDELSCASNGAMTCNPVVVGSAVWAPVERTLFGVSTSAGGHAAHKITTPGKIWDVATAHGFLWVISGTTVLKIDPSTGKSEEVIAADSFPDGLQPNHIATGDGRVWVSAMSPPGRATNNGRLLAVDASGRGNPTVILMPEAGSIATQGRVLWVERYHGNDRLQALDAGTGHPLGSSTTLPDDIAWLVPLGRRLMASTYDADSHARTIVPFRVRH